MRYIYENEKSESPRANNETSLRDLYKQKDLYDKSYPNYVFRPRPMEISSKIRSLYGRVDMSGFPIVVKQEFTSQLDSKESIFAIDFVTESFEEMVAYYRKLNYLGKLSKNSVTLQDISPIAAMTVGIEQTYEQYMREQIEFFNKEYVRSDKRIKNYSDYERDIRNFSHFLSGETLPFTLSEFCTSKILPSTETGLIIDISSEDPSEDSVKYQGYIRDPNYENYTKVAYRFGFKVDKDIPWRLYYDLSSTYAKRKLAGRGIYKLEDFFERYYNRTVNIEFANIAEKMASMYKSYIDFSPTYQEIKPCTTSLNVRSAYSQGAAKVELKRKEIVNTSVLLSRYEHSHWIRLYAFFRATETAKIWTQTQFDDAVDEASKLFIYRSESQGLHFLESNFIDRTSELFQKKSLTNEGVFDTLIYKNRPTYTF